MSKKRPDYINVPTTKGLQRVKVITHYALPEASLLFVLHTEPSGQDRLTVTEVRTGFSLGNVRGAWDFFRRLSDGYSKADLKRFCEAQVLEVIHKHGMGKLKEALEAKPTVNLWPLGDMP